MSKPIVLVGLPSDQSYDRMIDITHNLTAELDGYHVLVYPRRDLEMEFKVFNESEASKISIDDLKKYIHSQME